MTPQYIPHQLSHRPWCQKFHWHRRSCGTQASWKLLYVWHRKLSLAPTSLGEREEGGDEDHERPDHVGKKDMTRCRPSKQEPPNLGTLSYMCLPNCCFTSNWCFLINFMLSAFFDSENVWRIENCVHGQTFHSTEKKITCITIYTARRLPSLIDPHQRQIENSLQIRDLNRDANKHVSLVQMNQPRWWPSVKIVLHPSHWRPVPYRCTLLLHHPPKNWKWNWCLKCCLNCCLNCHPVILYSQLLLNLDQLQLAQWTFTCCSNTSLSCAITLQNASLCMGQSTQECGSPDLFCPNLLTLLSTRNLLDAPLPYSSCIRVLHSSLCSRRDQSLLVWNRMCQSPLHPLDDHGRHAKTGNVFRTTRQSTCRDALWDTTSDNHKVLCPLQKWRSPRQKTKNSKNRPKKLMRTFALVHTVDWLDEEETHQLHQTGIAAWKGQTYAWIVGNGNQPHGKLRVGETPSASAGRNNPQKQRFRDVHPRQLVRATLECSPQSFCKSPCYTVNPTALDEEKMLWVGRMWISGYALASSSPTPAHLLLPPCLQSSKLRRPRTQCVMAAPPKLWEIDDKSRRRRVRYHLIQTALGAPTTGENDAGLEAMVERQDCE